MNDTSCERAVSPVVAVILMVAVTVALSAVIGLFVLDLGDQVSDGSSSDLGVQTEYTSGEYHATVITGNADELSLRVNGTEVDSLDSPQPGDELTAPAPDGSDVTVVETSGGDQRVVTSDSSIDGKERALIGAAIDDFERDSLTHYTEHTDPYSITTDWAQHGSKSLRYEGSNTNSAIYSDSGLNYFPRPGDTVEWQVRFTDYTSTDDSSPNHGVSFFFDKESRTYVQVLHVYATGADAGSPMIRVAAVEDGSVVAQDSVTTSDQSTGDEFRYVLDTDQSGMTLDVYRNGGDAPWETVTTGAHNVPAHSNIMLNHADMNGQPAIFDIDYLRVVPDDE